MNIMNIQYELKSTDFRAFSRFVQNQIFKKTFRQEVFSQYGLLFALPILVVAIFVRLFDLDMDTFFFTLFMSSGLRIVLIRFLPSSYSFLRKDGVSLKQRTLSISSEGILEKSETWSCQYSWLEVVKIDYIKNHLFIMLEVNQGFIVPKRIFPSESEFQAFKNKVDEYFQQYSST